VHYCDKRAEHGCYPSTCAYYAASLCSLPEPK
jgi:hypothetical protein